MVHTECPRWAETDFLLTVKSTGPNVLKYLKRKRCQIKVYCFSVFFFQTDSKVIPPVNLGFELHIRP